MNVFLKKIPVSQLLSASSMAKAYIKDYPNNIGVAKGMIYENEHDAFKAHVHRTEADNIIVNPLEE